MTSTLLVLSLLGGCAHGPSRGEVARSAVEAAEGDPLVTLEAAAADLDVGIRMRSLALLVRYAEEPGGGAWGPRALYDPSPYVKRAAVSALGERMDDGVSRELIAGVVRRADVDTYTRGLAGVVLARAGDHSTLPDLQAAIDDADRHWQRAPLALAAAMMGDAAAEAQLVEDLSWGDFPLEVRFFLELGNSELPALVPSLIECSNMVEEELLLPIAAALVGLESAHGESLFRDALSSKVIEQRLEAVDYLAEMEGDTAMALLRRARVGGPDIVRWYVDLVLIARGLEGPTLALDAIESNDRELRQLGVWALSHYLVEGPELSRRQRKEAYTVIISSLGDPEPVVVLEAVQGLAVAGRSSDRGVLAGIMDGESVGLGVEAAGAILAIEASGGVAALSPGSAAPSSL